MKKIILLALAAASLAAFALPATAMAVEEDVPIHAEGVELNKPKTVDGEGTATLTASFGSIKCTSSSGTVTFTSTTTGTLVQKFHGCTEPFGGKCTTAGQATEGTIETTLLEFHLLTVEDTVTKATGPGVLVTPNGTTGVFAHFKCPFLGEITVTGNGVIGTFTNVKCGEESAEPTIEFSSSSTGVQTHKTVVGTKEEYSLKNGTSNSSEDASGIITLGKLSELNCT